MEVSTGVNVAKVDDVEGIRVRNEFIKFLKEFSSEDDNGKKTYMHSVEELLDIERNTIFVNLAHIHAFSTSLANAIQFQFYRLYPFLVAGLHQVVVESCQDSGERRRLHGKQLHISFSHCSSVHKVRDLTADKIGCLVQVRGQVVRTHPVHPELARASFVCEDCGVSIRDVEQQFRYTQPPKCLNDACMNRTRFRLDVDDSAFVDFQRIRIQEQADELPRGSIPRSVDVVVRGELVELVQPGDRISLTGTLIVVPDVAQLSAPGIRADPGKQGRGRGAEQDGLTGLKALGVRDLTYKMAFLCSHLQSNSTTLGGRDYSHEDVDHVELWESMNLEEQKVLKRMSEDKDIERNLVNSIFPNIYGSEEVKLGVLLMLFGGVAKRAGKEGTTLRGDINVCLVGDPSTAKSQVLKRVEEFCPRAVYTSGKASSAAGLTAAVVKDEESFDFVIEAGALMLADNGVCCIDEFDKMDIKDQVAIHEAMEQQTISITKAGVKATLNARASILAAANPVGGRYDRSRPLKHNVQLSAPIMSRFDLFFVLIDECNEVVDYAIARRILDNHREVRGTHLRQSVYEENFVKKYIAFARCFRPKLSEAAAQMLVVTYKKLRMQDSNNAATSSWRITVRQLESLVRLSEALARLHCAAEVTVNHVERAAKLLTKSIIRVEQPEVLLEDEEEDMVFHTSQQENQDPLQQEADKDKETAAKIDPSKLKLKFEVYKHLSDMLVLHMRADEDKEGDGYEGVRASALVDWYLHCVEAELSSEQEIAEQKTICERVIKRLTSERIFVELEAGEDPLLVVHPNYEVDSQ